MAAEPGPTDFIPSWIPPPPWYTDPRQIVGAFFSVIITCVLIILGTLGNVLALIVFRSYQRSSKSSATFLLQVLCVVDTFYLLAIFPVDWVANAYTYGILMYDPMNPSDVIFRMVNNLVTPLAEYAECLTAWTVVVVSADRLIHIARPFFAMQHNMLLYAKRTVAILFIVTGLYVGRAYVINHSIFIYDKVTGQPVDVVHLIRFNWTESDLAIYDNFESWSTQFIFAYIPTFGFILPMNVAMIILINRSGKVQEEMKEQKGNEKAPKGSKSTRMIVVMVTVFVLLKMPFCLTKVYIYFDPGVKPPRDWSMMNTKQFVYDIAYVFTRFLVTVNSAVNCLIYFSSGKQFRRALISLVFGDRKMKGKHESGATETSLTAQSTG